MITLTRTDTTPDTVLTLHHDLGWMDQHEWSPVIDSEERTVTGGLVVEPWTLTGGRPVTLASDGEELGLVKRSLVQTLEAWAAEAGLEMMLNYHGTTLDVAFRHTDGAAVRARRVWPDAGAPGVDDLMTLTLRLRTL